MNRKLYLFSFIILPLALSSCSYQPAGDTNRISEEKVTDTNQNSPLQNTNASGNTNNSTAAKTDGNTAKPANVSVVLSGFAFNPKTITVKKGTTVTWTNQDAVGHTVTADAGSVINFSSPNLNQGDKYQFTFNSVGNFSYYCSPHPNMKGQIIVTE